MAVGFGISTPAQARAVADLADGVIVGSRLVRAAGEGGAAAVGDAVRRAGRRAGPASAFRPMAGAKANEQAVRSYFDADRARATSTRWPSTGAPTIVEDIVGIGVLRGPAEVRAFFPG